jgi:hypothetical protein
MNFAIGLVAIPKQAMRNEMLYCKTSIERRTIIIFLISIDEYIRMEKIFDLGGHIACMF